MQHRTWSAATLGLVLTASPLALAGPSDSEGIGGFGGLIPPVPQAQEPEFFDSRDRVDVHIVPQRTQVAPGGDIAIAIIFDQDERWHIHTNDPVVPPELGQPEDYYATAIYAESADGRLGLNGQRYMRSPFPSARRPCHTASLKVEPLLTYQ